MELTDKKLQVMIASPQFLYRLGIKTMLSAIGVEPELLEAENFDEIKEFTSKKLCPDYVIVCDNILEEPKTKSLLKIKDLTKKSKLMIISNNKIADCQCSQYITSIDSQREVLDKFQEFFFEPKPESESEKAILSDREIDILKAVALGYANKEIADKLYISINTVITHRKNITDKLGIKTIAGLTVYAIMNNLINPDEVKK